MLIWYIYKQHLYIYIPGTQMTPVLIWKGLLFEGSNPKIEDKQVPGIYIYKQHLYIYTLTVGIHNFFNLHPIVIKLWRSLPPLWIAKVLHGHLGGLRGATLQHPWGAARSQGCGDEDLQVKNAIKLDDAMKTYENYMGLIWSKWSK